MYLNKLNDKQKKLFLHLVYAAAIANGEYSEFEKLIMNSYCREVDMKFNADDSILDAEEVISELASISNDAEKRIIVFEVMGLIMADYVYDDDEKLFMEKLISVFNVDKSYVDKCAVLIENYYNLQNEINALVL